MTNLSHEQAREYIQQGHLVEDDRLALRRHLASCDACRAYAAVHVHLLRQLPLRASGTRPTAEQRATILAAAEKAPQAPRFWRLLAAVGGLAVVLFLATAVWLLLGAAWPVTSQLNLPASWTTLLAPFLPQPTPTVQATAPATIPAFTPSVVASPTPVGTPDPRGRYVIDTVPAPSLAGNLIGEPLEQEVVVYLPPSYDNGDRRYPVVYVLLLPSQEDGYKTDMNALGYYIRSQMNLTLKNGGEEMIVVALNTFNALNIHNYFINSPVTGNWEEFLANDLVAYIDGRYRTLPVAESRGIFSEITTGLGTLTTAMRYPQVFGNVFLSKPLISGPASSAWVQRFHMSDVIRPQAIDFIAEAESWPADTSSDQFRELFAAPFRSSPAVKAIVAYGITFVPDVESGPPYFKYPFSTVDGPPDADVLRRWENGLGNLSNKLQPYEDELKSLEIHIGYVSYDPNVIHLMEQLSLLDVPFTSQETEDGNRFGMFFEDALTNYFSTQLEFE